VAVGAIGSAAETDEEAVVAEASPTSQV